MRSDVGCHPQTQLLKGHEVDSQTTKTNELLVEVKGLKKHFPIQRGLLKRTVGYVKAVDGVDFYIKEGETF